MLNFLKNCHNVFHSHFMNLHSHQQHTGSQFSDTLPETSYFLFCFDNCHSNGCEVVYDCGFNVQFPKDQQYRVISCVYWLLNIFFAEIFYSSPLPFLNYIFILLLRSGSFLYIQLLSDTSCANIFSHSKGCLFTLLVVSFAVQNFLTLKRNNLSGFFFFCCFVLLVSCQEMIFKYSVMKLSFFPSKSFSSYIYFYIFILFLKKKINAKQKLKFALN